MKTAMSAWVLCFSLVVQAAAVLPVHRGQADAPNSKENSFFLQAGNSFGKSARWEPPWEKTTHHASDRLKCGVTEQVGAHTDKYEDCPADCPYFAQNRKDTQHCTFLCVAGDQCGTWNAMKPIPDSIKNTKTCRGPKVAFCDVPNLDGTDTCDKCQAGFNKFSGDQQCYFTHWTAIIVVAAIFGLFFAVVIAWVVDLFCRGATNQASVDKTTEWRSRSKIINRVADPDSPEYGRTYPTFSTCMFNFKSGRIAGPGMTLHFRFQLFFIVWPFVCALVWVGLACMHNELFILGTRKFGTPRHNCILVAWGFETQQRLMWTKVLFLVVVYIGSFISFLWFSLTQAIEYKRMDADEQTMKDFALELKGLPELSGDVVFRPPGQSSKPPTTVESKILEQVQKAIGASVELIGVSVAWNYSDEAGQEAVEDACNEDLAWREAEWELQKETGRKPNASDVQKKLDDEAALTAAPELGAIRKQLYAIEKKYMGPDAEKDEDLTQEQKKENLVNTIKGTKTSDVCFVVFKTAKDRDEVLANTQEITFKYREGDKEGECQLQVNEVGNEPANINWHNFGDSSPAALSARFWKGFFTVYVPALLVWFFIFYCPYAWSLYNFNYDNGAELPGYYSIIFTIVVCGGNATMYVVCDLCCDIIGFRYKDTKQVTYMLMYLAACMINVFLDMAVTYKTAMKVMVGQDFRTYHGERLADITVFTEQFETYAMQRSLGENVYRYAWPSTFFLCFVLEPFVTILIPYQIGKMVVRTHNEIRGVTAQNYLMAFEFDLGRYADILLNVFLGILIFYFPGGYIWGLFFAMSGSHCFIYCFDHWRVINVIPYVKIVSCDVDWWAQLMMGGCCAVILSCLVFKANCETYVSYCMQEIPLIASCSAAGLAHFIVHSLLLIFLVPMLADKFYDKVDNENDDRGKSFETVAAKEPRTWFAVNPMHCLRSKFIHKHSDHCRLAYFGKEHLLIKNEAIGCYFEGPPGELEDFSTAATLKCLVSDNKPKKE